MSNVDLYADFITQQLDEATAKRKTKQPYKRPPNPSSVSYRPDEQGAQDALAAYYDQAVRDTEDSFAKRGIDDWTHGSRNGDRFEDEVHQRLRESLKDHVRRYPQHRRHIYGNEGRRR